MKLLLFGLAVEPGSLAAIALRGLQDAAPLLVGVDRPLHACHWMFLLSFTISWSGRRASSRCGSGRRVGQPFSRRLMRLVSLADTVVRPSRRRVRLVGLCSSRCRRLACWRTILPVPVRRNRFDAPLWVLALGMFPLFYEVLELSGV